jgi:hypothetical protein
MPKGTKQVNPEIKRKSALDNQEAFSKIIREVNANISSGVVKEMAPPKQLSTTDKVR